MLGLMAARASCQSVVASMLFGARFRMPFRIFRVKVIELIPTEGEHGSDPSPR